MQWDDDYSDFEMAWTSFDKPAKIQTHVWMGMIQEGERETRVHPTQKPVQLMMDCINYVKPEASVVYDGFSGSGSSLLACQRSGCRARW
jgi:site-specific DNA-methyltransferase (adenine-specific)